MVGKKLYSSYQFVPQVLGLILIAAILSMPAIELVSNIHDSYKKYYARHHKDKYITELRTQFAEEIKPFEFDYKLSNFNTLYLGGIQVNVNKNNENINITEVKRIINALPESVEDIRVIIHFGKSGLYKDTSLREHFIDFVIDRDKSPTNYCHTNDYDHEPNICDELSK